jgi:hypothetical protein
LSKSLHAAERHDFSPDFTAVSFVYIPSNG